MLSNFKLFFILISFVLLSKEILVFNEETLILFSFVLFLYLSYKFLGYHFYKELDDRNSNIEKDFQYCNNVQKSILLNLFIYYENQKNLVSDINSIVAFVQNVALLLSNRFLFLLRKQLYVFVESNLKKLISVEKKLKNEIQQSILEFIINFLDFKFGIAVNKANNRMHLIYSIKCIIKKK